MFIYKKENSFIGKKRCKHIAIFVIFIFLYQNLAWAYPTINKTTLAVQSQFKPITEHDSQSQFSSISKLGIPFSFELEIELVTAIRLALAGQSPTAINALLDTMYSNKDKKRVIDFQENEFQEKDGNSTIVFTLCDQGERSFKISYFCNIADQKTDNLSEGQIIVRNLFQRTDGLIIEKVSLTRSKNVVSFNPGISRRQILLGGIGVLLLSFARCAPLEVLDAGASTGVNISLQGNGLLGFGMSRQVPIDVSKNAGRLLGILRENNGRGINALSNILGETFPETDQFNTRQAGIIFGTLNVVSSYIGTSDDDMRLFVEDLVQAEKLLDQLKLNDGKGLHALNMLTRKKITEGDALQANGLGNVIDPMFDNEGGQSKAHDNAEEFLTDILRAYELFKALINEEALDVFNKVNNASITPALTDNVYEILFSAMFDENGEHTLAYTDPVNYARTLVDIVPRAEQLFEVLVAENAIDAFNSVTNSSLSNTFSYLYYKYLFSVMYDNAGQYTLAYTQPQKYAQGLVLLTPYADVLFDALVANGAIDAFNAATNSNLDYEFNYLYYASLFGAMFDQEGHYTLAQTDPEKYAQDLTLLIPKAEDLFEALINNNAIDYFNRATNSDLQYDFNFTYYPDLLKALFDEKGRHTMAYTDPEKYASDLVLLVPKADILFDTLVANGALAEFNAATNSELEEEFNYKYYAPLMGAMYDENGDLTTAYSQPEEYVRQLIEIIDDIALLSYIVNEWSDDKYSFFVRMYGENGVMTLDRYIAIVTAEYDYEINGVGDGVVDAYYDKDIFVATFNKVYSLYKDISLLDNDQYDFFVQSFGKNGVMTLGGYIAIVTAEYYYNNDTIVDGAYEKVSFLITFHKAYELYSAINTLDIQTQEFFKTVFSKEEVMTISDYIKIVTAEYDYDDDDVIDGVYVQKVFLKTFLDMQGLYNRFMRSSSSERNIFKKLFGGSFDDGSKDIYYILMDIVSMPGFDQDKFFEIFPKAEELDRILKSNNNLPVPDYSPFSLEQCFEELYGVAVEQQNPKSNKKYRKILFDITGDPGQEANQQEHISARDPYNKELFSRMLPLVTEYYHILKSYKPEVFDFFHIPEDLQDPACNAEYRTILFESVGDPAYDREKLTISLIIALDYFIGEYNLSRKFAEIYGVSVVDQNFTNSVYVELLKEILASPIFMEYGQQGYLQRFANSDIPKRTAKEIRLFKRKVKAQERAAKGNISRGLSDEEIMKRIKSSSKTSNKEDLYNEKQRINEISVVSADINEKLEDIAEEYQIDKQRLLTAVLEAQKDIVQNRKTVRVFPAIVKSLEEYVVGFATDEYLAYSNEMLSRLQGKSSLKAEYIFHEALCFYLSNIDKEKGHQIARQIQKEIFKENYTKTFVQENDANPELTGELTIAIKEFLNESILLKEEKHLFSQHADQKNLLQKTCKSLRGYPVNMTMDLNVISEAVQGIDAQQRDKVFIEQLSQNMRTLARSIAWYDKFGMDIKYILKYETDQKYADLAKEMLENELNN
ncbi:MAG: hypothetical protein PHQ52_07170, partial [Candidatus Omnitrophica bacterium]|nr:hypothetical protein [Candidatus Omnitrophota bacterium]